MAEKERHQVAHTYYSKYHLALTDVGGKVMFSVQFLITKKWRGPFITGVMSTQVPNRGNEFHAHVLSPQQ